MPGAERALITGGAGHVGGGIARALLDAGWAVRVLDLRAPGPALARRVEAVAGDVRDPATVRDAAAGCDLVVHAAMQYEGSLQQLTELAIRGVEACAGTGRRLVYVGSCAAVGECDPAEFPQGKDERHWATDSGAYGTAKVAAERRLQELMEDGVDAVAINPAMMIGPHDPTGTASNRRVLGLAKIARFAPAFDGGLGVVDVADVGAAAVAAVAAPGARYLLCAHNLSMTGLLTAIRQSQGRRGPPRWRLPSPALLAAMRVQETAFDRLGQAPPVRTEQVQRRLKQVAWFDSSLARRELAWTPRPLAETLRDLLG